MHPSLSDIPAGSRQSSDAEKARAIDLTTVGANAPADPYLIAQYEQFDSNHQPRMDLSSEEMCLAIAIHDSRLKIIEMILDIQLEPTIVRT